MSYLGTFFALVSTLTLVGKILLAVQINSMVIGLNCEDRIVKSDGSTGLASVNVINF